MATYPITFTFDYANFIVAYPEFSNPLVFPETTLQGYWDSGNAYVDPTNYGWLTDANRLQACNLITAHIARLFTMLQNSNVPGLVQNSTIDKITVGLTPPPLKNQFQWWLSLTPYGQMLLALLQVNSVGGFYTGSLAERTAFRSVDGIFPL